MSIVCNVIRLFGRGAQNVVSTVLVLQFCKYYTLCPKKNCCNDSTTTIGDALILCLCQIPIWFVKRPNWGFVLAWEKIEVGKKLV